MITIFFIFILLTGCETIRSAYVDPVEEPGVSSMLVVEAFILENYGMGFKNSTIQTYDEGWYPLVEGPDGSLVKFRVYDSSYKGGPYYFVENIKPGTYTIKGWRYLWMKQSDYLQTPINNLKFNGYKPEPFQQVDDRMLVKPYTVEVEQGVVVTLGSYSMKYCVVSAINMSADDRRKITEFEWLEHDLSGKNIMSDISSWSDDNWKEWNRYNSMN